MYTTLSARTEHVWEVTIQKRALGEAKGICGPFRVCLTDKSLSLVRIGHAPNVCTESIADNIHISLQTIRRCGSSQCIFYLEIGRVSMTGAGEFWMETSDPLIAQNMHEVILG